MRKRVSSTAVGIIVLTLAVASPTLAEKVDRHFHQSFDVQEGAKLILHHGDGEVSISPWEKNSIDVEVVYRASIKKAGAGSVREFEVEFDQSGDTVRVVGREPSVSILRGLSYHWEREYSYTVKAPRWVALELDGRDGDVSIREWGADIALETSDGDVEIDGLLGDFEIRSRDGDVRIRDCETTRGSIRTSDGDVALERCEGSLQVEASDGGLTLSQIRGDRLDLRTSDGDVELDLMASEELDLTIRSGDGNVAVGLDPGLSVVFTIQTGDGDVRMSEIEVAGLRKERRHTSGRIGDGRGSMKISTGDGDVVLRQN